MSEFLFQRVAIIGVGLIGGSLAAGIKRHCATNQLHAPHIIGIGRHIDTIETAKTLGLIDQASTDFSAIAGCDLVVICAPVAQTEAVLRQILPYVHDGMLVTDAGSTKQDVIAAARRAFGANADGINHGSVMANRIAQFIPAHPIAGKESNGPAAADANLYQNKRVVITPLPENTVENISKISALWQAVGAQVSTLSAIQHDAVFSAVSHLPHLLSYALVAQIANAEDAETKLGYAGAGFRDFTRIAASSPEMWRDIFVANKTALLKDLRAYQAMLSNLETLLVNDEVKTLERVIQKAATVRQAWQHNKAQDSKTSADKT